VRAEGNVRRRRNGGASDHDEQLAEARRRPTGTDHPVIHTLEMNTIAVGTRSNSHGVHLIRVDGSQRGEEGYSAVRSARST
jgi:hypothetical protein